MISYGKFLSLSLFLFLSLSADIYCSDTRPESTRKDLKRCKRIEENVEATLASGMLTMNLSTSTPAVTVQTDPLLAFCDAQIPFLSFRELTSMLDEAIFNQNFGIVKLFKKHNVLDGKIDSDHLESLCRSSSEISTEILEFILDNSESAKEVAHDILSNLLSLCVPRGLEKFKFLWTGFNGAELDVTLLSGIISKIAAFNCAELFDFAMESLSRHGNSEVVLKRAFTSSVLYCRLDAVGFLLENERISLSSLDLDLKMKLLNLAVNNNSSPLVAFLLEDEEVLRRVRVMPRSPWLTAIKRDYPEVLEVIISALPDVTNTFGLVLNAFSQRSVKILNYFMERGLITASMYLSMAQTAIISNSLEAFVIAIEAGMDVEEIKHEGVNLLTFAVQKNSIAIVSYLLERCHVDPNAVNVQYDGTNVRTTSTAILFAKDIEMVRLLAENGADVNAKYVKQNHLGTIIRSATLLHKAAAEQNYPIFAELIARGADFTIPDEYGITNEDVYYRKLSNLSENF